MDQEDPAGGEDRPQRDPRSKGHRLSDRLCGSSHAIGQVSAECRYADDHFLSEICVLYLINVVINLCNSESLHPAGRRVSTVKPSGPPHYSLCVLQVKSMWGSFGCTMP